MAAIIGSKYCKADPTDIGVLTSVVHVSESHFLVTDVNSNIMFRVKDTSSIFKNQRTLFDSDNTPVVTLRPKKMSAHHRWIAYRGDKTKDANIIFSAKQSSMFGSKPDLNIYLQNNDAEDKCDFKVDSSFVFYKGHSDKTIIAKPKEHMVEMSENVDSAFIVSLIVILDAINEKEAKNKNMRSSLLVGGAKVTGKLIGLQT